MNTSMSFKTLVVAGTLVVGSLLASASPALAAQGRGGRGGSPAARGSHGGGHGHGHGHGGYGHHGGHHGHHNNGGWYRPFPYRYPVRFPYSSPYFCKYHWPTPCNCYWMLGGY